MTHATSAPAQYTPHRSAQNTPHGSARPPRWLPMLLLGMLGLLLLFAAQAVSAASVPAGFTDRQIAIGFTSPTSMTSLPDGRLIVLQQDGVVRVIKADALLPTNFYAFANVDSSNERGCLGVVADPNFTTNHYLYFYCTTQVGAVTRNRVLRLTEAADIAIAGSERVIFELPDVPVSTTWHMGGAMRFGIDGKLYVAVGNHENNPQPVATANSQNLASAFGKILRINTDGSVPTDNPFYTTPGAYQAVYMLGMRNPFNLDIQPGTGLMLVGDVGQSSWEEVDKGQPGGNYGWPAVEGVGSDPRFINPIYAYSHAVGCAITGITFYNPAVAQFPSAYVGKFFFGDFCSGAIQYLDTAAPQVPHAFATGVANPTHIAISPSGSMYYIARNQGTGAASPGAGSVGKISYTGSLAPSFSQHPQSLTVLAGSAATFSAAADGATALQWQRNGVKIAGATGGSYTLAKTAVADSGARFNVVASNAAGSATSSDAILTVTTNRPPTARIDLPLPGSGFAVGDVIRYAGTGTDPEDGTLAGSAYTWQVDVQHDTHAHAFVAPTTGSSSGQFTVPDFESGQANMWLRITLTVRDSSGATSTVTRDIFPRTAVSALPLLGTPVNGWGPYEVDRSNGETGAADGHAITLSSVPYLHGLGVHALSDLRFALGGACTGSFIADLGIDGETGGYGSVVFQVWLDGVLAYDSGITRAGDVRKTVNVGVAGKNELRLVVTNGGDGNTGDHADWGGARVSGCPAVLAAPAKVSNLQVADGANSGSWSLRSNLQAGDAVYGDRAYTIASVPVALAGGNWIRSANASKGYAGSPLLSFTLAAAADVYVALDNRAPRPAWLGVGWVDTGTDLGTSEGDTMRLFSVFKQRLGPGTVTLGPVNSAAVSMYTVVVK